MSMLCKGDVCSSSIRRWLVINLGGCHELVRDARNSVWDLSWDDDQCCTTKIRYSRHYFSSSPWWAENCSELLPRLIPNSTVHGTLQLALRQGIINGTSSLQCNWQDSGCKVLSESIESTGSFLCPPRLQVVGPRKLRPGISGPQRPINTKTKHAYVIGFLRRPSSACLSRDYHLDWPQKPKRCNPGSISTKI